MLSRLRQVVQALMVIALVAAGAYAADLGQAKAQGLVGERADGYLQVMNAGAPGDVKQMVDSINAQRRAAYADIARKNKVSPEQVGRLTAPKAFNESPPGTFIETAQGWKRK